MKHKFGIIILIILLVNLLFITNVNANGEIEFSIDGKEQVKSGDTISLIIRASNMENQEKKPVGIKLDVYYEKELLEFVSAQKKDVANNSFELNQNYPEEGRIRIGIVSMYSIDKSGELYEVKFKAKENLSKEQTEVRIEVNELIDGDDNEIPSTVKNGIVSFDKTQVTENNNAQSVQPENNQSSDGQVENSQNVANQNKVQTEENTEKAQNIIIKKEENKNIKDLIKENYPTIDTEKSLTWTVENPEILEIDEEGNITPKNVGTTNIEITDAEGNKQLMPITIDENIASIPEDCLPPEQKNLDMGKLIIIGIIILVILVFIIIFVKRKVAKLHK